MEKRYTLIPLNTSSKFGEIAEGEIIEKKSKFIAYLFSIKNEEEAKKCLEIIKKKYFDAKHIVYIYSCFEDKKQNIRFSDDGEPKGTGTKAIYELLTKENICNVCIIIVRYFGGILLGAGPLSRTYLNAARECINKCKKIELYSYVQYTKSLNYSKYTYLKKTIDEKIQSGYIIEFEVEFLDVVNIRFKVREDKEKEILEIFN